MNPQPDPALCTAPTAPGDPDPHLLMLSGRGRPTGIPAQSQDMNGSHRASSVEHWCAGGICPPSIPKPLQRHHWLSQVTQCREVTQVTFHPLHRDAFCPITVIMAGRGQSAATPFCGCFLHLDKGLVAHSLFHHLGWFCEWAVVTGMGRREQMGTRLVLSTGWWPEPQVVSPAAKGQTCLKVTWTGETQDAKDLAKGKIHLCSPSAPLKEKTSPSGFTLSLTHILRVPWGLQVGQQPPHLCFPGQEQPRSSSLGRHSIFPVLHRNPGPSSKPKYGTTLAPVPPLQAPQSCPHPGVPVQHRDGEMRAGMGLHPNGSCTLGHRLHPSCCFPRRDVGGEGGHKAETTPPIHTHSSGFTLWSHSDWRIPAIPASLSFLATISLLATL